MEGYRCELCNRFDVLRKRNKIKKRCIYDDKGNTRMVADTADPYCKGKLFRLRSIFILGLNKDEAEEYARSRGIAAHTYTYLANPMLLRGIDKPLVIRVGNWILRTDNKAIENATALRNGTLLDERPE